MACHAPSTSLHRATGGIGETISRGEARTEHSKFAHLRSHTDPNTIPRREPPSELSRYVANLGNATADYQNTPETGRDGRSAPPLFCLIKGQQEGPGERAAGS